MNSESTSEIPAKKLNRKIPSVFFGRRIEKKSYTVLIVATDNRFYTTEYFFIDKSPYVRTVRTNIYVQQCCGTSIYLGVFIFLTDGSLYKYSTQSHQT